MTKTGIATILSSKKLWLAVITHKLKCAVVYSDQIPFTITLLITYTAYEHLATPN